MEALPQGGRFDACFSDKPIEKLTSGTYFERDDILVAKITPSFENGKQALARNLPAKFGYATTEVIPIRPKDKDRDARFVFFYLLHPDVRSFVAEKMEGATGRQRVPDRVLLELPIPDLDPRDEAQIANLLQVVQDAIATESSAEILSQGLKNAAMRELFTRGLRGEALKESEIGTLPESWRVVRLGEVCSLTTGTTPSTKRQEYFQGTIPFIKTSEIVNNRITEASAFVSEDAVRDYSLKIYPAGTVLMAMYGQGKTRGQVALLALPATTTQNAAAIQTGGALHPDYLWQFLLGSYERLRGLGSLGHISHLNLGYLREVLVKLPALDEQSEIAEVLNAIDQKIDLHKTKRAVLEDLFKSLLHKLMTGEIRASDLDLSALEQTAATQVSA